MKKIIIFLIAISAALASCEKVDMPYLPGPDPHPTSDTVRKLLLEDYTGHKCTNCPGAAYTVHNFQHKTYPGQVIAIAIHPTGAGFLTSPSGAPYTSDYRTAIGDNYFTTFKIPAALPMGTVNRKKNANGDYAIKAVDWDDSVKAIVKRAPDALLKITNTYDGAARKLTSEIKCSFLNTLPGTYNLVVLLTQDSIMSAQTNGDPNAYPPYASPIAHNYQHMHMLRACIDGSSGTGVSIGAIIKGNSVTKTFQDFPLPTAYKNIAVHPKHCNIVAFIYNTSTQEVVQAEEAKIQ